MKPKLIIPPCPHPNMTNRNQFWILPYCVIELQKNNKHKEAFQLENDVIRHTDDKTYKDLIAHMEEYFELVYE